MLLRMSQLPAPDAHFELNVRFAFHAACRQAFDQVKSAIKNGHLPNDKHIQWVVAVGPYFIIKGPFGSPVFAPPLFGSVYRGQAKTEPHGLGAFCHDLSHRVTYQLHIL